MSMKKTLFAVSLSFLVILSQAGCGSGAGANPPADSEQPVADPAASDADSQKTDDSQETDAKTKKRK